MSGPITKAMRDWCRRLRDPKACTLRRSPRTWMTSVSGWASNGSPNWKIVDKMETAGLIRFDLDNEGQEVASLTDAGTQAGSGK